MESLLTKLASQKLSTYAAITLMFTYTILLNRDFECSCERKKPSRCDVYLFLPFFIILLLIQWTDRSSQKVCRYVFSCAGCCSEPRCCSETTCNFWWSFFHHILKAALVGLLWVAFVYLDGDWYVCCENDHSEQQAPLACKAKAKANITEKERVIITNLKNESRVIGGITLFGIVVVASLIPSLRKCCKGKLSCCTPRFLYDKLILEEEDIVRKEFLRELAKDQLTKKVKNIIKNGWEDCSEIAVNLLKPPPKPPPKPTPKPPNPEGEEKEPAVEEKQPTEKGNEQEPLVQKEENNQHEEQEDRDASFSEESTNV